MDRMATKDRPIRVAIVGTGSVRTILSPIRSCKLTKSCRPSIASPACRQPTCSQNVKHQTRQDGLSKSKSTCSIECVHPSPLRPRRHPSANNLKSCRATLLEWTRHHSRSSQIPTRHSESTCRCDPSTEASLPFSSFLSRLNSRQPTLLCARAGTHGRVRKLYQHLGVPLVPSDFSYSFSRLSSSPPPPPPPPPARPDAVDASDQEVEETDEPPTPPPAYSEATESSRPPSPSADSDSDSHAAQKPAAAPARPFQTTSLIYQGASGLRWPPLSLPSHFHSSSTSLGEKVAYLAETAFLALSYLYLLALAFFYVSLGFSRPASTTTRNQSRTSFFERFGIVNAAAVPLEEFCEKHRVPRQMVDKVLIPLMAAVATVGVDQARGMPTGEVLGA